MRLRSSLSLTLCATLACGGDAVTGPIAMSTSEIITLFNEIAAALDATDTPFFLHATGPQFSRLGTAPPETYHGEAECPHGGRVTNTGGGEVGEVALDVSFTQSFDGCRTDNYTTSGSLAVTAVADDDGTTESVTVTVAGALTVTASNDRRGTCDVNYGYTFSRSPVSTSFKPTGTVCGFDLLQIIGVPLSF